MHKFKHFMYELTRSLFGPTMELINLCQDYYGKIWGYSDEDLLAETMYPKGRVH
jgi:hypothetical protein